MGRRPIASRWTAETARLVAALSFHLKQPAASFDSDLPPEHFERTFRGGCRAVREWHFDKGDDHFAVDWNMLPKHVDLFENCLAKKIMHGMGIWPNGTDFSVSNWREMTFAWSTKSRRLPRKIATVQISRVERIHTQ